MQQPRQSCGKVPVFSQSDDPQRGFCRALRQVRGGQGARQDARTGHQSKGVSRTKVITFIRILFFKQNQKLNPPLDFVPWILVDGVKKKYLFSKIILGLYVPRFAEIQPFGVPGPSL